MSEIDYSLEGSIAVIRINRPERRNALTPDALQALLDVVVEAGEDRNVRAVIFTGTGDDAFCAGFDIKHGFEQNAAGARLQAPLTGPRRFVLEAILEIWKPTIAALNGPAVAAGCEIALACDIRIAADHVRIGVPEAKRGMGAHFASVMLPRIIPAGIAFEMLYRGSLLTAEEAHRWGLVNHVTPKGMALEAALDLAREIVQNAPITLRRMKETAVKASGQPIAAALRLNEGVSPYESEDRKEGFLAFVEKRPPVWQGR